MDHCPPLPLSHVQKSIPISTTYTYMTANFYASPATGTPAVARTKKLVPGYWREQLCQCTVWWRQDVL